MSCEQISEFGAALALDALEAPERERLEAHLRHCPRCVRELRDLREVAAQFALSLPQHEPPAELGERIFAAAGAELAPASGEVALTPTLSQGERGTLTPALSQRERGRRGTLSQGEREDAGRERGRGRSTWYQRWAPAFSLASLIAAIAALLWGVSLQAQLGLTQRQLAETSGQFERVRGNYGTIVRVLASPQTQVRDLQPSEIAPAAQGKVWIDPSSGQGMMMARDLPALPESQSYQVWLTNGAGRISAGFLRPSDDGLFYVVLQAPGKLTDYQRLGVTREPAGGSPGPTGPRVIGGEI